MAEQGYIVISDITGYTAFLSESELEHAEDSLRSLLNLLIERTVAPLVVSRLEGDAVISYAPQGSFLQGQTLVEIIESTYVAFRQALERMVLNTTCTCNACRNIATLDLKFFVHYGTFMFQELGSHTELVGSDVNLVHRLTKNTITKKTGLRAYTVYTQAAVDALDIGDLCGSMKPHSESYEHLGEVVAHVQDMHEVWERERDRVRVVVRPEDALIIVEEDFPLPPALLWDYLTEPEYRAIISGSESRTVTGQRDGRLDAGSAYYCAHGKIVFPETIVDWQPFEQVTTESGGSPVPKVTMLKTVQLSGTDDGTRVAMLLGRSRGPLINRIINDLGARLTVRGRMEKGCRALRERIEEEIREGKVVESIPADIPQAQVHEAISESLAR